ncbi:MFS-type transporter SLC18B1-like isoform X5 [Chelonoidis abingdonii]|uniref:MFS-type transporter SLC18B1-like isoform X5 n=1 Tax=Chelonoidis abingdonii TaxID=106734 RepID=UPI0013F19454|nr:MFS-type transporter SLC18B1 isoform X2 [Chelonoidis abingdonii]
MGSQETGTQETLQTPVLENGRPEVPSEESSRFTRDQLFTMAATACLNFSSMICYSILGPFFPREAEKKGASDTVVGLIFGCFALFNFLTSLILGNYLVQIGAKFMFVAGMFVSGCVTILFGAMDAIGFAAAVTASFSILAMAFPNNIATVMGSLEIFTGLGLVLGPPLGGFLYQSFGYEVPFIVLGCLVLILVPLNMYLLPKYDAIATKDSFWMLITLPKVVLLCFTIFSLSACLGFLDPTMSLFVSEKFKLPAGYVGLVFLGLALSYSLSSPLLGFLSDKMPHLRKWLLVFGGLLTALSFFLLGPAPILHIESKLWMFVLMLVLTGFSLGMSSIPLFPEVLHCAYENGFEEGLSVLGLVSGLFSAMWSLGAFVGPTLGGFLNERLGFEWAATIQGGWALLSGLAIGIYYILEASQRNRRTNLQTPLGTNEERAQLLASET